MPTSPSATAEIDELVAALDRALAGEDPVEVPKLGRAATLAGMHRRPTWTPDVRGWVTRSASRPAGSTTCSTSSARRTSRPGCSTCTWPPGRPCPAGLATAVRSLRRQLDHVELPSSVNDALAGLGALSDQMAAGAREARGDVDETHVRLTQVRQGALGLAMVPLRRVVAAFPQLVREVATSTGKDVELVLVGEDVELDARVLDGVAEALGHLVTNAVDHGCGSPDERRAAGKSSRATVRVAAAPAGSSVIIEVADDGPGVDEDEIRATAVTGPAARRRRRPRRPAPARAALRARLQHPRGGHRDLRVAVSGSTSSAERRRTSAAPSR